MRNSSFTDWIQTLAIVIGVGCAIFEFIIQDRQTAIFKKEAVLRLIEHTQSESFSSASSNLYLKWASIHAKEEISNQQLMDYIVAATPFEKHYSAWNVCYEGEICDPELTLKVVCSQINAFDKTVSEIFAKAKFETNIMRKNYQALHADCNVAQA